MNIQYVFNPLRCEIELDKMALYNISIKLPRRHEQLLYIASFIYAFDINEKLFRFRPFWAHSC